MGKKIPDITPAELRIMKVLWQVGSGTVGDVKDALTPRGGDAPAYTPVMTMMKQLARKGALEVDRARQPFVYRPVVRREQVLTQRLRQFINTVYDGQAGELVLRLVEEAELSPDELKRIEERIEAKEQAEPKGKRRRGKEDRS